jgi:ATP-dependent DNA helicase RecQ
MRPYENKAIDEVLRGVWGYDSFRPGQRSAIEAQVAGKDALLIAPTGGGKSITYQLPALLRPGVTIVVTPLVALMKDQVDNAAKRGICAFALNHSTPPDEFRRISILLYLCECRLLYISPERLSLPTFQNFLKSVRVSAIVVDEAHCVAEYGPEFRPEYLMIAAAIKSLNVPIFACTATATKETEDIIIRALGMINPVIVRSSFSRPNLYYGIREKRHDFTRQIAEIAKMLGGDGIVYRATRAMTEETNLRLRRLGFNCYTYHAGMTPESRSKIQDGFVSGKIEIIVATIAFGMGIDKPDIRWVIHADIPKNIEESLNVENKKKAYQQFLDMISYTETKKCRRQYLLNYFGEETTDRCGNCDVCIGKR